MRATPVVALLAVMLLVGCGSDDAHAVAYDGQWELSSVEVGDCTGPLSSAPIPEKNRYFKLARVELPTGRLLASYACVDASECSAIHDFYYSFGWVDGAWSTAIYSAVKPPCQLSYTLRALSLVDGDTLRVETVRHAQLDASVAPEACTFPLAKARGATMPCEQREVWTARRVR